MEHLKALPLEQNLDLDKLEIYRIITDEAVLQQLPEELPSKIREQITAVHNFDLALMENDYEKSKSFLFGVFVNDDKGAILVRNDGSKKDKPDAWRVVYTRGEGANGVSKAVSPRVVGRSCTTRQHAELLMPEGVDAIEILHLDDDKSINGLCFGNGTFKVADSRGNLYLPIEGLMGGEAEQAMIDERFTEIVKGLTDEGVGTGISLVQN